MAPAAVPATANGISNRPKDISTKGDYQNGEAPTSGLKDADKTDYVLRTFRCLIADLCEQFKGGHPGYVTRD